MDSLLSSSLLAGYKVEVSRHPIKVQLIYKLWDYSITQCCYTDPCQLMLEKCNDVTVL